MQQTLEQLRSAPPERLAGRTVRFFVDYLSGVRREVATGAEKRMALTGSNVLALELEDGSKVVVRPSGTEPKMKIYLLCHGETAAACQTALQELGEDLPV